MIKNLSLKYTHKLNNFLLNSNLLIIFISFYYNPFRDI